MNEPCAMGTIQQAQSMLLVCLRYVCLWYACGILVIYRLTSDQWQGAQQSCHMSDGNLRLTRQVPKGRRNGREVNWPIAGPKAPLLAPLMAGCSGSMVSGTPPMPWQT